MSSRIRITDELFQQPEDFSWHEQAACQEYDNIVKEEDRENPFFMSWDEEENNKMIQEALALCEDCPVRMPCLQTALYHELDMKVYYISSVRTIYGGLLPKQRQRLVRRYKLRLGDT